MANVVRCGSAPSGASGANGPVADLGHPAAFDAADVWPAEAYDRLLHSPIDGLSMLLLLLKSSQWVHRRCESVLFHDDRTVARRVSVDFTVPPLAPVMALDGAAPVRLIPLTLLRKKTLVHFDLRDHAGTALPLIGLRQTQAITTAMLGAWAELRSGNSAHREPVRTLVHAIAAGTQSELTAATAMLRPDHIPETSHEASWRELYDDPAFGVVLDWMADNFILIVGLHEEEGARRIVKFSYDEPLTLRYKRETDDRQRHRREQLWANLGFRPTRVRFPAPAAENSQSYHFEIEAPPGVRIVEATMVAGRPYDEQPPSFDQVSGGFPRANLHVADVPHGASAYAQIQLSVAREGWLSTAAIASCTTAVVLGVAWLSAGTGNDPTDAQTVLLTVTAAVASLLVKPQEHRMTSRMLSAIRGVTLMATTLPFLAAALLVFGENWSATQDFVGGLGLVAIALATVVVVTWVRAGNRRDVMSPWEQGRGVDDLRASTAPSYETYAEAAQANGYDRPATIVASSEGQHRRDAPGTRRWDEELERSMGSQLEHAVRQGRGSAPKLVPS